MTDEARTVLRARAHAHFYALVAWERCGCAVALACVDLGAAQEHLDGAERASRAAEAWRDLAATLGWPR